MVIVSLECLVACFITAYIDAVAKNKVSLGSAMNHVRHRRSSLQVLRRTRLCDVSLLRNLLLEVLGSKGVHVVPVLREIHSEALILFDDVVLSDFWEGESQNRANEAQC